MADLPTRRVRFLLATTLLALLSACGNSTGPERTALASGGGTGGACSSAPPAEPSGTRMSFCNQTSWVAGATELCGGSLTYRDYVYDDYGADTGLRSMPIRTGPLAPSAGDRTYPANNENTADLVRFALRPEGANLRVEFELNTLYSANQTVAAIAIDTDHQLCTGGGIWNQDGVNFGVRSEGWEVLHVFKTGDPATNLITGTIPRPSGTQWRIWAVVAQSNGTVMNVAFRGTDEGAGADGNLTGGAIDTAKGDFWEDKQAAALRVGDITAFAASVLVAELDGGVTRGSVIPTGFHQRVYTSAYTLAPGEGLSVNGVPGRHGASNTPCEQYFHFLGKYQPYGFYQPAAPQADGRYGLHLVLHGCAANHASQINQPNMQRQMGEEQNRLLVAPLGRGPTGFYSDLSERDVLDVLADVQAVYPVDPDNLISGGYSMGGYGSLRMATLYPHLFAAATNWVGFTGRISNLPGPGTAVFAPFVSAFSSFGNDVGAIGNVIDFIQNLRNIPSVNLYAAADELVQVNTALAMRERFEQVEVPYDFYLHPNAEHLTFIALDDWSREADYIRGRRRDSAPARISFRTDASLDYPEYDIRHDRAYWISAIRSRNAGYADLDITSLGCGKTTPVYATGSENGAGPPPLVWQRNFRTIGSDTPTPAQRRITGSTANVSELTVDTDASCLSGSAAISYRLQTDGALTLRLSSGRNLVLNSAGLHEGSF